MEEKVLVTGKMDAKKLLIVSLSIVAVILVLSIVIFYGAADSNSRDWDYSTGAYFARYYLPWIGVGTAVLAALCVAVFFLVKKNEVEVTEKQTCFKGLLGKHFVLPNDALTSVGYAPIFGAVSVSSPSARAGLLFLENAKEVYEILLDQMLKRQK